MAKINKCNTKQSKTQIEIKWPHLHTKARSTQGAHIHWKKKGRDWRRGGGQRKKAGNMAKTSHSWPTKKEPEFESLGKNGKQVTEIKCSSCAAVRKKGNKVCRWQRRARGQGSGWGGQHAGRFSKYTYIWVCVCVYEPNARRGLCNFNISFSVQSFEFDFRVSVRFFFFFLCFIVRWMAEKKRVNPLQDLGFEPH